MTSFPILLSSGGRRLGLLRSLEASLERLGFHGSVIVADMRRTAPAFHAARHACLVPPAAHPEFVPAMLELALRHQVRLIVPTIDPELSVYAAARGLFARAGVAVAISSADCVRICGRKDETAAWLTSNGFPTVRTATAAEVLAAPQSWAFPVIAKPVTGSASIGVRLIPSPAELASLGPDDLVQERACGDEYTINVFVNSRGRCIAAVPHLRMEVRSGEVSKAITVKDPRLMSLGSAIAERLPGAFGALNVQCFVSPEGKLAVIEMNARFGGGYPLADRAGAHFAEWLIAGLSGSEQQCWREDWADGLAMLRYDEAVFVSAAVLENQEAAG